MKVIVTGILGQDGANMAEYLLANTEAEVVGAMRRSANPNYKNIESIKNHPRFRLVSLELTDTPSIDNVIKNEQPDYLINFAANSFVGISWDMPESVFESNALGVLRCLEAIRKFKPTCRFYSAGSSEEFGDVDYSPQDIRHPIKPRSPYGASKAAARHVVKCYRESYGLYAVHGILFNHEGPKRGEEFVTRKITTGVAKITYQIKNQEPITPIELGNLDAKRDWSDSRDFVKGVWMMLNQESFVNTPWDLYMDEAKQTKYYSTMIKDYILASGETHSIREFVEIAFKQITPLIFSGTLLEKSKVFHWNGKTGIEEEYGYFVRGMNLWDSSSKGVQNTWVTLLKINPKFYRPAEVELLMGDSTPIRKELGWKPEISLDKMVDDMIQCDLLNESRRRTNLKEDQKA